MISVKSIKAVPLLFCLGFAAGPVLAVEPAGCGQTTENACSSVDMGTAPVHSEWQAQLETAQKEGAACQADIDKFCDGIQVGESRLKKCLRAHRSKLSKPCRQAQGLLGK